MSVILDGANDKLQVVTSASADIEVQVSWVENNAGTMTPGGDPMASITSATTTDIVAVAGVSKQRAVTHISLRNNHGSTACDVTVQETDGTNTVSIMKASLLAGEALICDEVGGWTHYDVNGGAYPALGNIATQAEMEAGSSTSVVVTPGRQHFHPSAVKCWGKTTVSGGTPTLQVSYNTTSITDTATDQLTVTIATSFSTANYALNVSIEAQTTTLSATTTSLLVFVRNATQAAGSFVIQACEIDVGAATDPSSWHWQCCGDLP